MPADLPLLAFYRDGAPDTEGRTHAEILAWSDERLEAVHNYIQWLFPLPEPSGANPFAPLLTPVIRAAFHTTPTMQDRLRAAFLRMTRFYDFTIDPQGALIPATNHSAAARRWLTPWNHNYLRLTRILRALHLCGLPAESASLFRALAAIYEEEQRTGRPRISTETFGYWQRART